MRDVVEAPGPRWTAKRPNAQWRTRCSSTARSAENRATISRGRASMRSRQFSIQPFYSLLQLLFQMLDQTLDLLFQYPVNRRCQVG